MNKWMQSQMVELWQVLEATNIMPRWQIKVEPTTNTTKTRKVGLTISHSLALVGERRLIKLAPGAVKFPMTDMQEHAKSLVHIYLVLS
jgi:hypothetical protein